MNPSRFEFCLNIIIFRYFLWYLLLGTWKEWKKKKEKKVLNCILGTMYQIDDIVFTIDVANLFHTLTIF